MLLLSPIDFGLAGFDDFDVVAPSRAPTARPAAALGSDAREGEALDAARPAPAEGRVALFAAAAAPDFAFAPEIVAEFIALLLPVASEFDFDCETVDVDFCTTDAFAPTFLAAAFFAFPLFAAAGLAEPRLADAGLAEGVLRGLDAFAMEISNSGCALRARAPCLGR